MFCDWTRWIDMFSGFEHQGTSHKRGTGTKQLLDARCLSLPGLPVRSAAICCAKLHCRPADRPASWLELLLKPMPNAPKERSVDHLYMLSPGIRHWGSLGVARSGKAIGAGPHAAYRTTTPDDSSRHRMPVICLLEMNISRSEFSVQRN